MYLTPIPSYGDENQASGHATRIDPSLVSISLLPSPGFLRSPSLARSYLPPALPPGQQSDKSSRLIDPIPSPPFYAHNSKRKRRGAPFGSRWGRGRGGRLEGRGKRKDLALSLSLSPFVRPFSYLHACWELRGAAPGGRAGKREREKEEKKSGYLFPIYVSGTRSWPSNGA